MSSRPADFQTQLAARVSESVQLWDVPWSPERAGRIRAAVWQRHRAQQRRRARLRLAGGLGLFVVALLLPRLWSAPSELRGSLSGRAAQPQLASSSPAARAEAGDDRALHDRGAGRSESALSPALWGPSRPAVEPASPSALRLADGSLASPRKNSAVAVRQEAAGRVVVELLHGSAEFAVTKNPGRLFRVEASGVAVEVLGTRFVVDKQPLADGFRVAVSVSEGRVRVLFSNQQAQLSAGERAEFQVPRDTIAPASPEGPRALPLSSGQVTKPSDGEARPMAAQPVAEPAVSPAPRPSSAGEEGARTRPARAASRRAEVVPWQQLARQGHYEQAYEQIFAQPPPSASGSAAADAALILSPIAAASHSAADLLLLADVARLSRHPDAAVSSLRQLLDKHSDDPRAPLAAFTLGRVQLDDLGRAREAAESFRLTQTLDGDGPMAQDALAREVEAWSRAGEKIRCRERAQEYLRRYPSGRRVQAVRHYAGLSSD